MYLRLNRQKETCPAFGFARNYNVSGFTSGWFLPATKEIRQIEINRTTINTAINEIKSSGEEATVIPYGNGVWTSCQGSYETEAVNYNIGYVETQYSIKTDNMKVLAVRALDD